jgi:hypothetical protein
MRLPATRFVVFNAAAGLIGLAAFVAAVRSVLMPDTTPPCSERYNAMTAFALERAGVVLTAADLQASLGGKDVGVIDNVTIGPLENAPAAVSMAVNLRNEAMSSQGAGDSKGGATFPWEPRVLQGKASACLSYHVLFPNGFDFQRGGALPGIGGAEAGEQGDKFLARLTWGSKPVGGATLRLTENGVARALSVEREGFEFARGKWVKLEQEVVLNTPKKSDGILRVWVDGTLAIERADIFYRARPDVTVSNVSVDVFYSPKPEGAQAAAPKDAKVWLTPFEVRWQ